MRTGDSAYPWSLIMSRHSSPGNKVALSRRELLALALTGCAWNWAQPALCWALGDEARELDETARSGRIIARVRGFASSPQQPKGVSGYIAIDAETGAWSRICDVFGNTSSVSRDGKTVAIAVLQPGGSFQLGMWTSDIENDKPFKHVADIAGYPVWSPDSKKILCSIRPGGLDGRTFETWRMNADGTDQTKLPFAESDFVIDWSPDGQWLALVRADGRPLEKNAIQLIHPDGTGRRTLTEDEGIHIMPRFSPDGRRILYSKRIVADDILHSTLWLVGLDGENPRQIPLDLEPDMGLDASWSPDGERLALTTRKTVGGRGGRDFHLEICDTDGKNRHVLSLPPGPILHVDWR
jgi:Tol biopolymer transport system component